MMKTGQITQLSEFDRNRHIEWLQDQRDKIQAAISKLKLQPIEVQLTGDDGREWHLMKRPDGSICLYWTQANDPAQYIVWDSLDNS